MSDTVEAVVSGTRVVVDVSMFRYVSWAAPWAFVALGAAGVAAIAAAVLSSRRALVLLGVPIGAIGAFVCVTVSAERGVHLADLLYDLHDVLARGDDLLRLCGVGVGSGLVTAAVALTTITPRARGAIVAVLAVVAVVAGTVGVVRVKALRTYATAPLLSVMPLPKLHYPGQSEDEGPPIAVHVGRTAKLAPERVTMLGWESQLMSAQSQTTWRIDTVRATLRPTAPGPGKATARATAGPVTVEVPVVYVGVEDRAPQGITLRSGHRQAWLRVAGRGGVVSALERKLRDRKASHLLPDKAPTPDVVLTVRGERDVDGLRVVTVQLDRGSGPELFDVVAKDGVLYRHGGGVMLRPSDAGCDVPLLGYATCRCSARGIERCETYQSNTVGGLVRMGMAIMTLGLSEMTGACKDCDAAQEEGLVLLP